LYTARFCYRQYTQVGLRLVSSLCVEYCTYDVV